MCHLRYDVCHVLASDATRHDMCHVSCVMCHVSCVMSYDLCHVLASHATRQLSSASHATRSIPLPLTRATASLSRFQDDNMW